MKFLADIHDLFLDKGHLVSFVGDVMHGGDPVLYGTRYIIAGFMLLRYRTAQADPIPIDTITRSSEKNSRLAVSNEVENQNESSTSFSFDFNV